MLITVLVFHAASPGKHSADCLVMARCPHKQWLDLSGFEREWSLSYGQRYRLIIESLKHPSDQFPSTIFFVGKQRKISTLQHIFVKNNLPQRQARGIANLHLDQTDLDTDYPLLFADCNPDTVPTKELGRWNGCHETNRFPLGSPECVSASARELAELVCCRLLFLFTDVICLFADDLGGLSRTFLRLRRWCERGSSSVGLLPSILVITSDPVGGDDAQKFHLLGRTPAFLKSFTTLELISMPRQRRPSPDATAARLKSALVAHVDRARRTRIESMTLFSATHLGAFFDAALRAFTRHPQTPFDFLETTRLGRTLDGMTPHTERLLSLCQQNAVPPEAAERFIASALWMDAQPRAMHRP